MAALYQLDPQYKYLEPYHQEFDKLIQDALTSPSPLVQQGTLAQAYQLLVEVEHLIKKKQHHLQNDWTEINFVNDKILHKIEQISNQLLPPQDGATDETECSNIMVQYQVLKLLDHIMSCKLISIENKQTSSLIYLVNNVFLLHDSFVGTTLAKRMVTRCKYLLNYITKRKDLNEDQEEEVTELLNMSSLKGSDMFINFEEETQEIKKLCKSTSIQDKLLGLSQLRFKLGDCLNLQEQLTLFATKCQPIIKLVIRDVKETDTAIFDSLTQFLLTMIFDSDYLLEMDKQLLTTNSKTQLPPYMINTTETPKELNLFTISEQKETLQNCEGLYSAVALIINFFLSFPKRINLQQTVLTVFKRLYGCFQIFRKNLEDPIVLVLINIQHKYTENELTKSLGSRNQQQQAEDQFIENVYAQASRFVNYLIQSDETEYGFKEKIFGRKELQAYLTSKNLESYKPRSLCLEITPYSDLDLQIGYASKQEIAAGGDFYQMVEVQEANSIIYCSFLTMSHDIQFGFYKVTPHSTVVTEGDTLKHNELDEIFPLQKVESNPTAVRVKLLAKEPGVYKILWSNSHSWFKGKELVYRVIILKPIIEEPVIKNEALNLSIDSIDSTKAYSEEFKTSIFNQSLSKITSTKRQQLQKLIDIPRNMVIKHLSNIDPSKKKEIQVAQWSLLEIYVIIDVIKHEIIISHLTKTGDSGTHSFKSELAFEDVPFILDEYLHSYLKEQKDLKQPDITTAVTLFISLTKSTQTSQALVDSFSNMQLQSHPLKFLASTFYDIYLMHDLDILVLYQALQDSKLKKQTLQNQTYVSVKCDLNNPEYFDSSVIVRGNLVQDATSKLDEYSYEAGNIGALQIVMAVQEAERTHSESSDQHGSSGDERINSSTEKQHKMQSSFVNQQLRNIWQELGAIKVALDNLLVITGSILRVRATIFNGTSQIEELFKSANKEGSILVETSEDETLHAMKHLIRFVEIYQAQFTD